MNNDFDKKIKDLLHQASPAEAGFSLDKNAVWDKIESKKSTKAIPFRKWLSHAAAVLIGILICVPFLFHSHKETAQTVTITKAISSPAHIIKDTVFVEEKLTVTGIKNNKNFLPGHPQLNNETVAGKASEPAYLNSKTTDTLLENIDPETQPNVASSVKRKLSVLHMVDLQNENTVPRTMTMDNYVIFKKISIPSLPNDHSETISMLIVKPSR